VSRLPLTKVIKSLQDLDFEFIEEKRKSTKKFRKGNERKYKKSNTGRDLHPHLSGFIFLFFGPPEGPEITTKW
jgi:hypothetical protein